ncbi:MAG: adenylyl-sulfate kinase [Thermoprotei archaeon]|nr:adenylyl-sulfate kinase [Thermoprotei archaeon]
MSEVRGAVIWFTGLPGSGKTTVAKGVMRRLKEMGYKVELLDGDEVRKWLSPEAGFTREDRERHLIRVAHVAKLLARNGVLALCSFVSPYRYVRQRVRGIIEEEAPFVEVYVRCSLNECMRRDPKGLYKRALRGEIKHMTGVDDPYEEPLKPEVIVDTEHESISTCVVKVLNKLKELDIIA